MATPPQGARSKAAKLRKQLANGTITDIDRLWLDDYTEQTNGSGDWGKSASRTRVHRTETVEEDKAAEGTGTAAAHAAGLALMAKEEGRRLDSLTTNALDAYKQCVADYRAMFIEMKGWMTMREERHNEMLEAVTGSVLAQTDAEVALREKEVEEKSNGANEILTMVLAKHLGIDLKTAPSPKNGAAKK